MTYNSTLKIRGNLKIVHHDDLDDEWYEVLHNDKQVLTVRREEKFRCRWVAKDTEGRQAFEPEQYRNDLFERIEHEGEFE